MRHTSTKQPEALRLADLIDSSWPQPGSVSGAAASELRRLHEREIQADAQIKELLQVIEDLERCSEMLSQRVQELGETARENRSRRIVELEGRIAELESEAEQNAKIIGASAETELALRGRIAELEAARIAYASEFEPDAEGNPDVGNIHANIRALKSQLSAIGAGGVEPLRKTSADTSALRAALEEAEAALEVATSRLSARGANYPVHMTSEAHALEIVRKALGKSQEDHFRDATKMA